MEAVVSEPEAKIMSPKLIRCSPILPIHVATHKTGAQIRSGTRAPAMKDEGAWVSGCVLINSSMHGERPWRASSRSRLLSTW